MQDSQKQVKFNQSPRNQKQREPSPEEDETLQEKVCIYSQIDCIARSIMGKNKKEN